MKLVCWKGLNDWMKMNSWFYGRKKSNIIRPKWCIALSEYWIYPEGPKKAFTRPAVTPPKVNRFGWNLERCEPNVKGWPWQTLGAIRAVATVWEEAEIVFFGQVNNARFHRFPVVTLRISTQSSAEAVYNACLIFLKSFLSADINCWYTAKAPPVRRNGITVLGFGFEIPRSSQTDSALWSHSTTSWDPPPQTQVSVTVRHQRQTYTPRYWFRRLA